MTTATLTPATTGNTPLENVLQHLQGVKKQGQTHLALCPAHDDKQRSLSLSTNLKGDVLLKCHAGCTCAAICQAIGVPVSALFTEQKASSATRRLVAAYDYTDEHGKLLFQAVRYEPKQFLQRCPDGADGWNYKLGDVRRVLYHLPEVLVAIAEGRPVYVVEGEKDVERLRDAGLTATCNAGGAGKWIAAYTESLRGADVVILPDNDSAGRDHAQQVSKSLLRAGGSVRVLELPGLRDKGDVSDWLNAGHTIEELLRLTTEDAQEIVPLDASMQRVLAGLQKALESAGVPVMVEPTGLPTLPKGYAISDVTRAIRIAEKFRRKAKVVVGLFIGALVAQAGNAYGAQKEWAETAFGKDKSMYQTVRECVMVYRAWEGVYNVNLHDATWSGLLLGARRAFAPNERKEFVERPKMPTGPELKNMLAHKKAQLARDNGNLTESQSEKAKFDTMLKALVQIRGQQAADALLSEFNARLMEAVNAEPEAEDQAEAMNCCDHIQRNFSITSEEEQSQQTPEVAEDCCDYQQSLPPLTLVGGDDPLAPEWLGLLADPDAIEVATAILRNSATRTFTPGSAAAAVYDDLSLLLRFHRDGIRYAPEWLKELRQRVRTDARRILGKVDTPDEWEEHIDVHAGAEERSRIRETHEAAERKTAKEKPVCPTAETGAYLLPCLPDLFGAVPAPCG